MRKLWTRAQTALFSVALTGLALSSALADDDYVWATTNGGTLALIDATTATNTGEYSIFSSTQNGIDRLGSSLWIANVDGAIYGVSSQGQIFTVDTSQLVTSRNKALGYLATQVGTFSSMNITGITFDTNTNLLEISTGQSLYSLSFTGKLTLLGSYQNQGVGGITWSDDQSQLLGLRFSPSPAQIVSVTQKGATTALPNSTLTGASSTASVFYGSDGTLFATDGNNTFYTYTNGKLTKVGKATAQGGLLSFTSADSSQNVFSLDLSPSVAPEPGTVVLEVVGLAGLGGLVLRRRRLTLSAR